MNSVADGTPRGWHNNALPAGTPAPDFSLHTSRQRGELQNSASLTTEPSWSDRVRIWSPPDWAPSAG